MPKKDSKIRKTHRNKRDFSGSRYLAHGKQLKEQIEAPMVRLSYAYAMDVVQAKLK